VENVIHNVTVAEKAWKVDGFSLFHFYCVAWMIDEQEIRSGNFELLFWVCNERFPVARFRYNDELVVELFYYPHTKTAACLSGKTLHDSTKKITYGDRLLAVYLNAKFPAELHREVHSS
jgi:hypothetical protein